MQGFVVGLVVLLAVAFMIRHIRRAGSGHGGCGCGCGSSDGETRDHGRRVSVPGLTCSGSCAHCRGGKASKSFF